MILMQMFKIDWMMYSNTNKARRIRFSGSAIDAALEISIDCEQTIS